jgi:hypothetical protein
MTEFTKTKIHFVLALLASLFALHPFLARFEDSGFLYLGYDLKIVYVFTLTAGLLALCAYCYGVSLVSERPYSWLERLGNYSYALSVMMPPLYGVLYLAAKLADLVGQSHLAWAAPAVALGVGLAGVIGSQLLAWLLRGRLGSQDRSAKIAELANQEEISLNRAQEMLANEHYDLAVIEVWRAVETRLRRVLLSRGYNLARIGPDQLIHKASRAGIIKAPALALIQELQRHWSVAIGTEPVTKEAANAALTAARHVLATIALPDLAKGANLKK